MGPAAAIASLASVGLSAAGAFEQGLGESRAAEFKAEQDQLAAEFGKARAMQTNAQMTQDISLKLSHMDAVMAAAHTSPRSPTEAAVRGTVETASDIRKNIATTSILNQALQDDAAAAYERSAAKAAMLGGDIGALGAIAKGIAGLPFLSG